METTKTIRDQAKDFYNTIVATATESKNDIILIVSDGEVTTMGLVGSAGRLAIALYNAASGDSAFRQILEATLVALDDDRHGDDDDEEADNNFDDYDDYDEGVDQDLPDCPALPADEA